ncbi:cytochrome P450 [Suillus lakei]|nr:cytochrome P450 [Suillus lakei]
MLTLANFAWLCLACVGVYLLKQVFNKKNPAPYPPGPPGWPLIGNILDMPHIKPWLTFTEWGQEVCRAAVNVYSQVEEIETRRFLKRVYTKPDQLQAHVSTHRWRYRALDHFSLGSTPGTFIADFVPFLVKVPEWFPGAGFKRLAREWHDTLEEMVSAPYKFVMDQMVTNICKFCEYGLIFNFYRLLALPRSLSPRICWEAGLCQQEDEHHVKWSAATLYAGASDTVVSTIYSFFLAMMLFPDVQKKAQAEIDARQLAKEALRWHVVAPTGFPHCVTEDDIHDGYYIPKGGKKPETEPRTICFGFGRRICPGIHLAEASVWLSAAMSLAVFDISKAVENGVEITPEVDPLSGTISHPKPFKCSIKPRSAKAVALIQQDANY